MDYDQISLTTFNKDLDVKVPLSKDKKQIISLYRSRREQGMGSFSAVKDAVAQCMNLYENTNPDVPRVLVLFSDGDDNYSKSEMSKIIEKANEQNIIIFSIAFGYSKDDEMRAMAKNTGGKFYKARSDQELIAIFRDIYMSLRQYYLISYHPPKYWGFHEVIAGLTVPGRNDTLFATGDYDTSGMSYLDTSNSFTRPILFDFDSAIVKPASFYIIDEIVDAMLSWPKLRLEIQGHTDNVGTIEYNQALSDRRADSVVAEIVKRGIDYRRLRARGFGMSMPVASNETEEGRARNRRTQFQILAK